MKFIYLIIVFSFVSFKVQASEVVLNDTALYHELDSGDFRKPNLSLFNLAIKRYNMAVNDSSIHVRNSKVTIINFDLPSTEKRLWVIDIKLKKILHQTYVAHGKKTGANYAKYFSNKVGSHKSSIGTYLTQDVYYGKHGSSLRLKGLEKEWNTNARKRAVVMHTATYANESFIKKYGRLGRSFGCPAIPTNQVKIIKLISEGGILFIYSSQYDKK